MCFTRPYPFLPLSHNYLSFLDSRHASTNPLMHMYAQHIAKAIATPKAQKTTVPSNAPNMNMIASTIDLSIITLTTPFIINYGDVHTIDGFSTKIF